MSDELFPSGPWTGFYNYTGPEDRHRMDLHLDFRDGQLSGEGNDNVGAFVVAGGYDTATHECWWKKTYPASHDVAYRGFAEDNGIWGRWDIPPWSHGGFHIWPRRAEDGESVSEEETVSLPAQKTVVIPSITTTAIDCESGLQSA